MWYVWKWNQLKRRLHRRWESRVKYFSLFNPIPRSMEGRKHRKQSLAVALWCLLMSIKNLHWWLHSFSIMLCRVERKINFLAENIFERTHFFRSIGVAVLSERYLLFKDVLPLTLLFIFSLLAVSFSHSLFSQRISPFIYRRTLFFFAIYNALAPYALHNKHIRALVFLEFSAADKIYYVWVSVRQI